MDTNQIKQNLLKLKDSFLEETEENKKMLVFATYLKSDSDPQKSEFFGFSWPFEGQMS